MYGLGGAHRSRDQLGHRVGLRRRGVGGEDMWFVRMYAAGGVFWVHVGRIDECIGHMGVFQK